MTARALGRRPADQRRAVLDIGAHVRARRLPYPPQTHYADEVPAWLLGQNDRWGDCGPVSVANLALLVSTVLTGSPVTFTDAEILDLYRRSGNPHFDPSLPDGDPRQDDQGVDMTVLLSELVSGGIGAGDRNVRALAFGKIPAGSLEDLWTAAAVFGGVLVGADLDVAQEQQTDAGKPWTHTPRSPAWGGHAVLYAPAYVDKVGTSGDRTDLVSWGQRLQATNSFYEAQVPEAYVVIWPWHLGDAQFVADVDLAGLAGEYEVLTGRKFPEPVPPPAAPAPAAPADGAPFPLTAVQPWLEQPHGWAKSTHAAAAIRGWLEQEAS